jgi:hypothetical protein
MSFRDRFRRGYATNVFHIAAEGARHVVALDADLGARTWCWLLHSSITSRSAPTSRSGRSSTGSPPSVALSWWSSRPGRIRWQKLLAPKRDGVHPDYGRGFFERYLHDAFDVRRSEQHGSGTRILYFATPGACERVVDRPRDNGCQGVVSKDSDPARETQYLRTGLRRNGLDWRVASRTCVTDSLDRTLS